MQLINIPFDEEEIKQHLAVPSIGKKAYCLNAKPMSKLSWWNITSLGFGIEGESEEKGNHQDFHMLDKAASLFAASGKPFSLLCEHVEGSNTIVFAIGCEETHFAEHVLRSAFGTVKGRKYEPQLAAQTGVYTKQFEPVRLNHEEMDKRECAESIHASTWVDDVCRILIGFPGMVQVDFQPIDADDCDSIIKQLHEAKDKISTYLDTNIQISDNVSRNTHKWVGSEVIDNIQAGEKFDRSASGSLSWKNTSSTLDEMRKEVDYLLQLFSRIKKDGWQIDFFASADLGLGYIDTEERDQRVNALIAPLSAAIVKSGYTCLWDNYKTPTDKEKRSGMIASAASAVEFISFPTSSFCGFERVKNRFYNVNVPESQDGIPLADLMQFGNEVGKIILPKEQLNRHAFVCGMTGSGKTNTVHTLLSSVEDIPYLVIEPVKGEYRSLPGITAYTMTAGSDNALPLNPFWFPRGSSLQYHIDCLKQIISSAFDLYEAMPNILEQCLSLVYQHCGWDFVQGRNRFATELPENMLYPTFSDLCREVDSYLDQSKFSADVKANYRGALLSRLQSFTTGTKGLLLDTTKQLSFEELETGKVVISLDALADDSDKSIVMGVILAQYYQYRKLKCAGKVKKGLHHITVIEEAHHLFAGNQSAGSHVEGGSGQNASQELVKTLNNMLAEIRAYGEGFIIVDQSPSALHPAVLKNTGIKIAHRVDYGQDIDTMQEVLLLEKNDRELATLKPGQALLRFGGMRSSTKVYIPRCETKENAEIVSRECVNGSSVVSHLLEDKAMSDYTTKYVIKRFLNHLLYDDLSDFESIYKKLCTGIEKAVNKFGHTEVLQEIYKENALAEYIDALLPGLIEPILPTQHCTSKMIQMFTQRLLTIALETRGNLSTLEIRAFGSYREHRIWYRMSGYYEYSDDPNFLSTASVIGNSYHVGIITKLVSDYFQLKTSPEEYESKFDELLLSYYFVQIPLTRARLLSDVKAVVANKQRLVQLAKVKKVRKDRTCQEN